MFVAGANTRALADGGTVRLSEMQGPYRITALTSPNPFRSGPVEINVLVQDATTGDALPDANVRLSLAPRDEPDEARLYVSAQRSHHQQAVSLGHVRAAGRGRVDSRD